MLLTRDAWWRRPIAATMPAPSHEYSCMTDEHRPAAGWDSDFYEFRQTPPARIRERLEAFITDASPEQIRAWRDSIPPLQFEVAEVLEGSEEARGYSAILEYELPMDSRRPDAVFLAGAGVLVVELKGKLHAEQADIDQASAYARDLRCYHRECHSRPVIPILVPTRARGSLGLRDGVLVCGPDELDKIIADTVSANPSPEVTRERFLSPDAYCPLPTLVQAARELFERGELRTIHRARAATDPCVNHISQIIHTAALTRSRHLILVTGVPGAGKTLVGLRAVHSRYLDDISTDRDAGRPTAPAVFLSGNGPLVEVLQYELRAPGGGGATFVRGVKEYVKRYSSRSRPVPPEHVLVFDEAQRAFDRDRMADTHGVDHDMSEPDQFITFANRVPDWCVVVGLIGSGQEIHTGEEAGTQQWVDAVNRLGATSDWTIHLGPALAATISAGAAEVRVDAVLDLDQELRFHAASDLHRFVAALLTGEPAAANAAVARELALSAYHLRITRDLDTAKRYMRQRYESHPDARFGLLASSKDKLLPGFGVANDFQSTKRVRFGPWYGDAESDEGGRSCRHLDVCVTEFGAQGLELDAALLAWGSDYVRRDGSWSNALASGYRPRRDQRSRVKDPFQLRMNAYRVLLTRGRDATVVYVPSSSECDETFDYLVASGFQSLEDGVRNE